MLSQTLLTKHLLILTVDTTAPTITGCPSTQQVDIQLNAATTPTATVTFPVPLATDSSGSPVSIAYTSVPPGLFFAVNTVSGTVLVRNVPIGTTVVMVTATDNANNPVTCRFNIVGNSGNSKNL